MSESPNTIDELMSRDPLSLTTDNIDSIIAYHRKARANAASGKRPAKGSSGPKVDISAAMANLGGAKPSAPMIRRR